jgi:uncharacterized MnhB-related membrane protein
MIELAAGLLVLIASAYAIWARDLLASAISLSVAGFSAAAYFLVLQAPDVAMAEAAVGAGIIPLVIVVSIAKTRREE